MYICQGERLVRERGRECVCEREREREKEREYEPIFMTKSDLTNLMCIRLYIQSLGICADEESGGVLLGDRTQEV